MTELARTKAHAEFQALAKTFDHIGYDQALRAVAKLSRATRDAIVAEALVEYVTDRARTQTRIEERRATRTPRKGTAERAVWESTTVAGRRSVEIDEQGRRKLRESIDSAVAAFREAMRVEWTNELLAAPIAMKDGTRTTWGHARIDQHRERLSMFSEQAQANVEAAARHHQAIEDLEAAGVDTLAELVGIAA